MDVVKDRFHKVPKFYRPSMSPRVAATPPPQAVNPRATAPPSPCTVPSQQVGKESKNYKPNPPAYVSAVALHQQQVVHDHFRLLPRLHPRGLRDGLGLRDVHQTAWAFLLPPLPALPLQQVPHSLQNAIPAALKRDVTGLNPPPPAFCTHTSEEGLLSSTSDRGEGCKPRQSEEWLAMLVPHGSRFSSSCVCHPVWGGSSLLGSLYLLLGTDDMEVSSS